VPFDTNLGLITRIVEKVGRDLMVEPGFGVHIIKPLESLGVVRMAELGMVLGVKCTTKPNEGQFVIRREAYHRIRDAFAEHGIPFARQNTKVEVPTETDEQSRPGASSHDDHESAFEHEIAFDLGSPHRDHSS
jgi:moderate conductance mechanosensitive channel